MHIIRKLYRGINLSIIIFAMLCLVAMALITVTNVVMRYCFNTGLQWGEEITLVLVIWFTFIAMALGVKLDLHINISILPKNLPVWLEKSLVKMKQVIILVIGLVFLVYGIKLVGITSRSILPATELPSSIMYLPIPIASIIIIFESFLEVFGLTKEDNFLVNLFDGEAHNG